LIDQQPHAVRISCLAVCLTLPPARPKLARRGSAGGKGIQVRQEIKGWKANTCAWIGVITGLIAAFGLRWLLPPVGEGFGGLLYGLCLLVLEWVVFLGVMFAVWLALIPRTPDGPDEPAGV
jgi:hypothetical protein